MPCVRQLTQMLALEARLPRASRAVHRRLLVLKASLLGLLVAAAYPESKLVWDSRSGHSA